MKGRTLCALFLGALTFVMVGCASSGGGATSGGFAPTSSGAPGTSEPTSAAAVATVPTVTSLAAATSAVVSVSSATLPLTGSQTQADCSTTEHLVDDDGDLHGQCEPTIVAVNTWSAQAAAVDQGLPPGTNCDYPDQLTAGQTATVECVVVNPDQSAGVWEFTVASDSSVTGKPSYRQTTAAPPPSTAAVTTAAPQPVVSATDPRFGTCKEAKAHGYGPYVSGRDPEYDWYRDADHDGIVCE